MVFEVQEQLVDLRAAREDGRGEAEGLRGAVDERRTELNRMIEGAQRELAQNFARWDAPNAQQARAVRDDADRDALVMELKTVLSKIAYLRTLIRDIDREFDSAQAA